MRSRSIDRHEVRRFREEDHDAGDVAEQRRIERRPYIEVRHSADHCMRHLLSHRHP
jgi:hypothetical protein